MEMKGLAYETVLIDNMGKRPRWYSGQTPQVRWEDGNEQGESLDILRALDRRYPDAPPLWPSEEVTELVDAFRRIFPSGTRPSSRAAFLFKGWGATPVPREEFEAALDGADELLGRHGGPFFHGPQPSAADCAWAPFLERYAAQLPCLHAGLDPRDGDRWPRLAAWYAAMEERVPAYSARVQGDAVSWRRVLAQAGFGNSGVAPVLVPEDEAAGAGEARADAEGDWPAYAEGRPHVAATPAEEAAARIVRNRRALAADAAARGALDPSEADAALRGLAAVLSGAAPEEGAPAAVAAAAAYLDERMCVPRDMGVLPGRAVRALAGRLSRS